MTSSAAADAEVERRLSRADRWIYGDITQRPRRTKFHLWWAVAAFLFFLYTSMSFYPPEGLTSSFAFFIHLTFTVFLIPYGMVLFVKYCELKEQGFYARQAEREQAREQRAQEMLAYARQGSGEPGA